MSRSRGMGRIALAAALAGSAGAAAGQERGALRCPPPAELAELARSFGTGGDNERRAYAYFGQRFGRPAALRQDGSSAEITYGGGRATVRIGLERAPATGLVAIRCR